MDTKGQSDTIQLHEFTLPPYTDKIPVIFQEKFDDLISELENVLSQLTKSDLTPSKNVYNWFKVCGHWYFKDSFRPFRRLVIDKLCEFGFVDNFVRFYNNLDKTDLFKSTFFNLSNTLHGDYRSRIIAETLSLLCNFTDASTRLGSTLTNRDGIPILLELLQNPDLHPDYLTSSKWDYVNSVLGTLGNIARLCPGSRPVFRQHNAIKILRDYSVTTNEISKADCYLTLSFIITDEEVDLIENTGNTIRFLINTLEKALKSGDELESEGYSPTEILLGLNNLALNDSNKLQFVDCGGLKLLAKSADVEAADLKSTNMAIRIITAEVTWKLAFMDDNRPKIKDETKLVKALKLWQTSCDKMLKKASSGALWEIYEGNLDILEVGKSRSVKMHVEGIHHVMLSYQWDVQPMMIKLKKKLQRAGYNVWMDVDRMEGDILQAMASAVENSAVLLIAVSKKYKESNSCRTEATYAYKHSKPIIPLLVENKYVADGWLGALIGTLKYFKIDCDSSIEAEFDNIKKEIGSRGLSNEIVDPVVDIPVSTAKSSDDVDCKVNDVSKWNNEEVKTWLISNRMDKMASLMKEIDGEILVQMVRMANKAPEFFYSTLKADFQLNLVQILKFANSLEKLNV